MRLSIKRYSFVLFFQFLFLFTDLLVNSFSYLARNNKLSTILLFVTQDLCLILSITLFIYSMYSTYVYQAGLPELLYRKFRLPILILTLYFILSVAYHVWIVLTHQTKISMKWTTGLTILFIAQRLVAPVYYYLYKRSTLRMSDPRFYENVEWITKQLSIK